MIAVLFPQANTIPVTARIGVRTLRALEPVAIAATVKDPE
jgi:hypothetical protein